MAEKKTPTKKRMTKTVDSGRVPPHNIEMERALLGSMFIDPDGFSLVIGRVNPEDFYDRRHQIIFNAMSKLFSGASPIDVLSVCEKLSGENNLEAAGDAPYIVSLSNEVATSAHARHYADIVRERATLRKLITSSINITAEAFNSTEPFELIDRAMSEIFEIYSHQKRGGFVPIRPIMLNLHEHLEKLHNRSNKTLTGVGTGFTKLDELTSGFQKGDFVVVAGRPSMGKTAFCLDIARNACMQYNVPVAFFSLEMASMAIGMRLIAANQRVNLHRLRSGTLSKKEWPKVTTSTGVLSEMPFHIDDSANLGIMEIRARARMLKQQNDIGIIFIDYLQLMKPPPASSREQEVAQISRALKALARELNIPVVALSQLSRAVEQRGGDKRPQLSDLRDSGAIEQDADLVAFIYRKKQYKKDQTDDEDQHIDDDDNEAEIIVRKQRNGPTGTVKLYFNPEFARFEDRSDQAAVAAASKYSHPSDDDDDAPPF